MGVVTLIISLPSGRELATPVFINYSFDVKHEVRGLATVVKNLKAEGVNLVAEFTEHSNVVPIQGIIGQDILDFIEFRKVPCMNGSALELANGLMPSGNTEHFLFPGQMIAMTASIYLIVAISFERYAAVHYPLNYHQVRQIYIYLEEYK